MNAGSAMRRRGGLGVCLGVAYLAVAALFFLDVERFGGRYLSWLARPLAGLVVGGDPSDPSVQESFQFLLFFGSIVFGSLVLVSLLAYFYGKTLESRAKRHAVANAV